MTFEDARAAIYGRSTAWTASHSSVIVQYENRAQVDLATARDPYLQLDIMLNDGEQLQLGDPKGMRYRGGIWLSVWQREGSGVKPGVIWLGELALLFRTTSFGGVNTQGPMPVPSHAQKGWFGQILRVPFWFDDLT